MTEAVKAAPKTQTNTDKAPETPKTEQNTNKAQAAPKTEQKGKPQTGRSYIFDQPGPMFKPKVPSPDWVGRRLMIASMALTKMIVLAAALSTFAKKETQAENGEAVLTAGTLGMTLMKTTIQNGNPKTDFDGKMILTETANEIVQKIAPQMSTKPLFKSNPIKNGAFDKLVSKKKESRE